MRRVLEFLIGLRDDRAWNALAQRGFGVRERELGWQLVQALGMTQSVPIATSNTRPVEGALDAWQKEWLYVARASLEQSHPKAYDELFHNLGRRNKGSLSTLVTFLARYEKLSTGKDVASRAAIAKLQARGLTPERIAEAKRWVAEFSHPAQPVKIDFEQRRTEIRNAEAALWSYYREWSQIARAVIRDVRLLRLLGYRGEQSTDEDITSTNDIGEAQVVRDRKQGKVETVVRQRRRGAHRRRAAALG